ncbi:uncharacterized protein LOC114773825 [Denticeps clupeoides]|uniref:uncharacterized protein LOC114773825 n=1 Tax=Denticeps clupeoides TaxID=299321 RepID=UPI0010A415F8|nr:uncharacterized protein LOC114773825 [Denticeps clupeoides]
MPLQRISREIALLCLLITSAASELLRELSVDLGQNVTLDCTLKNTDTDKYWCVQLQSQSPVIIMHSFYSDSTTVHYYNDFFKKKYSLQIPHRLFIQNISRDELGIYYCLEIDSHLKLSGGTRLSITDIIAFTDSNIVFQDQTKKPDNSRQDEHQNGMLIFFIFSCLLNCIFIVLFFVFLKHLTFKNHVPAPRERPDEVQYSDIKLSAQRRDPRNTCTVYAVIQKHQK